MFFLESLTNCKTLVKGTLEARSMATPSPTWTRALALLAVLFAVLSTGNAINKGGDAAVFFEGGRRFLAAEPLYAGSSAADGFIGPPFQAVFFAPFASSMPSALSLPGSCGTR